MHAMAVALHQCPSCSREVSQHDARCPDCRQVLGTDNLCEQCHALAPATRHGHRIVCSACQSVRARRPNTVVSSARALRWLAAWERFRVRVYGGAAASSALFGLLLGGLLLAYAPGSWHSFAWSVLVAMALVTTAFALRIKRVRTLGGARDRFMLQQRLLGYAHQRRGVVTAEGVAHHLDIPVTAADAMLDDLVRVGKADMDVSDRGEISFALHAPRAGSALPRGARPTESVRPGARQRQRQST